MLNAVSQKDNDKYQLISYMEFERLNGNKSWDRALRIWKLRRIGKGI